MTHERLLARAKGRSLADDLVDPDIYAKGVDDGWNDVELYRLIVRQPAAQLPLGHRRRSADDARQPAAPDRDEMGRGHGGRHRAHRPAPRYAAPAWVDEPERFLDNPVKLTRLKTDSDSAWQAGAFLRHGVSVDSRDLDWRTGDDRHWTAEL